MLHRRLRRAASLATRFSSLALASTFLWSDVQAQDGPAPTPSRTREAPAPAPPPPTSGSGSTTAPSTSPTAGLTARIAPGRVFYVDSQNGDDSNHGTSPTSPMRTLAQAVTRLSRSGGDKLILRGVFNETLSLNYINNPVGGSPDPNMPTVIQCDFDANGNPLPARIDGGIAGAASFPFDKANLPPGFGPGSGNYLTRGITVSNSNYVTVSGIEVSGIAGVGVLAWRSSHVSFEHMLVEWVSNSAVMFANGDANDPFIQNLSLVDSRINQSNLGAYVDRANNQGFSNTTETVTLVRVDGFEIARNHVSNSMMQGIDFKFGSRNGVIHHNLVENIRHVGIYCNEGDDTDIFRNLVRHIGWYDPQDGGGLQLAAVYLENTMPRGFPAHAKGATGIRVANGDLGGPRFESGRSSGIRVFENVVSWTRKRGIAVWNEWRVEGLSGYELDDIHIFNNVVYKACHAPRRASAAMQLDVAMTNSSCSNNIVLDTPEMGLEIWDALQGNYYASNSVDNNLFWATDPGGEIGANAILADPMLADPPAMPGASGDFMPLVGSPALGAGLPIAGILPGPVVDLGAFQSGAAPWVAGPVAVSAP